MEYGCPRGCGKTWATDTGVAKHLSQKAARCYQYYGEVIPLVQALRRGKRRRDLPPLTGFSSQSNSDSHEDSDGDSNMVQDDGGATMPNALATPSPSTTGCRPVPLQEQLFTYHIESYAQSGTIMKESATFIDRFNMDKFSKARLKNIYHPFTDNEDWEYGSYLMRSSLSMAAINELLSLRKTKRLKLSFKTAEALRHKMESLPQGPEWRQILVPTLYPTKRKVYLYYRDILECIEAILQNPLVTDYVSYSPMRVYRSAQKTVQVYSNWLTSSAAWDMQDQLPEDATLLGIILSSDKTNITSMTGNRVAHPLLISLANLNLDFRSKSANNAYLLLALLPVPKFVVEAKSRKQGVLEARLIHQIVDFIVEPAKQAAKLGYMIDDAFGRRRYSFTGLAGFVGDLPELQLVVGVGKNDSPMSTASYEQLGDAELQPRRTRIHTLSQIEKLNRVVHPWALSKYIKKASSDFRLNSVHKPFWRDWGTPALADPANFINPDPLHFWHKAFHDHDLKWCINALGKIEIDIRYSSLHPHTGFRRFPEGVSQLRQSTMRENRDLQRYIVAVIAGAVTQDFVITIRALCDIRYRAQAPVLDDEDLLAIDNSIKEFHQHRHAIIDAGARRGKKGPIDSWHIPKLETLLNISRCTRSSGVPSQYSTERTENEHIRVVKRPSRKTNNQNYEKQICQHLDRTEKIRVFEIATEIRAAAVGLVSEFVPASHNELDSPEPLVSSTKALLEQVSITAFDSKRKQKNYFEQAQNLIRPPKIPPPGPLRTIIAHNTAIHLKKEPCGRLTLDAAIQLFRIFDLRSAFSHYMKQAHLGLGPYQVGGRRIATPEPLPFESIAVWTKCQLQNKAFYPPHAVLPATTINASPPHKSWQRGQSDPVIVNVSKDHQWPYSGLQGHVIAQLCLIMLPIPKDDHIPLPPSLCQHLAYVCRFDIVPQLNPRFSGSSSSRGAFPDPATSLFIVRRAKRANSERMGDIIPIQQVRSPANLVPRFGEKADKHYAAETSLIVGDEFYLNKYFTREMFYSLTIPMENNLPGT